MTTATHAGYAAVPSPRPRQAAHDLTLVALHNAIHFSGLWAKYTAQRWGLRNLADAAEQVAAEFIALAVKTTGNPDPHPRYTELGELRPIGIRVSTQGNGLLIEVWDSDSAPPAYRDNHLSMVEEICQQWDWYQPNTGGKVIRAELSIPQPRRAEPAEPLPVRVPGWFSYPEPDEPVTGLSDLEFLRRVRDGLHGMDTEWGHRGEL